MQNPIAVSTWSVHNHLGYAYENGPGRAAPFVKTHPWGKGVFDLLQLPRELKNRGYDRCEICHFHIGHLGKAELGAIKTAFADEDVHIQTMLIDDGDLTNVETRERDVAWISQWIEVAAAIGAEHARVIAGKAQPTDGNLALAIEGLRRMVAVGQNAGVKIVTENWFDLLSTPQAVHDVLDGVDGLGFLADTGNWTGRTKYHDLESIFQRASLCHAKASLAPGLLLDEADFGQCLNAAQKANYTGPLTLIFADDGDEWQGLDVERRFAQAVRPMT